MSNWVFLDGVLNLVTSGVTWQAVEDMRPVVTCIQVKLIYLSAVRIESDVDTSRTQALSIIVVNPDLLNWDAQSLRSVLVCNLIAVDAGGVVRYCILRNGVGNLCVAIELRQVGEGVLPVICCGNSLVLNLNAICEKPDNNGSWALTVVVVGVVPEFLARDGDLLLLQLVGNTQCNGIVWRVLICLTRSSGYLVFLAIVSDHAISVCAYLFKSVDDRSLCAGTIVVSFNGVLTKMCERSSPVVSCGINTVGKKLYGNGGSIWLSNCVAVSVKPLLLYLDVHDVNKLVCDLLGTTHSCFVVVDNAHVVVCKSLGEVWIIQWCLHGKNRRQNGVWRQNSAILTNNLDCRYLGVVSWSLSPFWAVNLVDIVLSWVFIGAIVNLVLGADIS